MYLLSLQMVFLLSFENSNGKHSFDSFSVFLKSSHPALDIHILPGPRVLVGQMEVSTSNMVKTVFYWATYDITLSLSQRPGVLQRVGYLLAEMRSKLDYIPFILSLDFLRTKL